MRNLATLVLSMSVALSCSTAVYAQQNPLPLSTDQLVRYGPDIEGWTVYANKTRGDCLIVSSFGPASVQMGVDADEALGYLGVFTQLDIGIQNGTNGIFVEIGGNLYAGVVTTTTGQLKGGYSGGYILRRPRLQTRRGDAIYDDSVPANRGCFRHRSQGNLQGHGNGPEVPHRAERVLTSSAFFRVHVGGGAKPAPGNHLMAHTVPLSGAAVKLLEACTTLAPAHLSFPGPRTSRCPTWRC